MTSKRLQEIERLYHAAREKGPGEREAFLEKACGGDESLRKEVESLLACRSEAKDFLEAPAVEVAAKAIAEGRAESHSDLVGRTLLHYRIIEKLGQGGMGEVYQAKDQKLGRDVAIKVLPEEFAKDAERVARFQREAKVLASLNHPNIAAIHELEESDGTKFLVLELVEGKTLADRLKHGPIPVEESLKLALQIAEAPEAAHEKGIIHRDMKPANIKVTPDGKVKLLDFGLAKAFAAEQAEINLLDSPTLSDIATQQGIILGTAAYMSPEQARGKSVDKRADIWAFGCVLFEMLTGRQLFKGETVSEILAAVLMREPDFSTLPPNLHPRIRLLLERCLEKEIKNRYNSIGDARVDIQKVLADPSGMLVQSTTVIGSRTRLRMVLPWVAAAAVLSLILAGVAVWNLKPKPKESRSVVRFAHVLPEGQAFTRKGRPLVSVSPDGTKPVYVANRQLYLRTLTEPSAKPIQGAKDPANPFFSPDGQWVGYWSGEGSKLKKIAVSGGVPITLCSAYTPWGATWEADDMIIFGQPDGVMSIAASGGTPKTLVKARAGEQIDRPQVLPGGRWLLFTSASGTTNWDEAQIVVQSLESGERKGYLEGRQRCALCADGTFAVCPARCAVRRPIQAHSAAD